MSKILILDVIASNLRMGASRNVSRETYPTTPQKEASNMRYIPFKALKILAMMLHALYSIIYPKYSKHGRRKVTIPQKLTLITIAKAFGYTYRDIPAIAEDLKEVPGIRRVTTFQNFNHFARRIKPQELQDAMNSQQPY